MRLSTGVRAQQHNNLSVVGDDLQHSAPGIHGVAINGHGDGQLPSLRLNHLHVSHLHVIVDVGPENLLLGDDDVLDIDVLLQVVHLPM